MDDFEKFLRNRRNFYSDILQIVTDEESIFTTKIQIDLLDDIIHHYEVIVKDKIWEGGDDG